MCLSRWWLMDVVCEVWFSHCFRILKRKIWRLKAPSPHGTATVWCYLGFVSVCLVALFALLEALLQVYLVVSYFGDVRFFIKTVYVHLAMDLRSFGWLWHLTRKGILWTISFRGGQLLLNAPYERINLCGGMFRWILYAHNSKYGSNKTDIYSRQNWHPPLCFRRGWIPRSIYVIEYLWLGNLIKIFPFIVLFQISKCKLSYLAIVSSLRFTHLLGGLCTRLLLQKWQTKKKVISCSNLTTHTAYRQ